MVSYKTQNKNNTFSIQHKDSSHTGRNSTQLNIGTRSPYMIMNNNINKVSDY
jgi:hypothetical protein